MDALTKAQVVSALGYTPPTTDTKYTHPSTHPASMITGLQSVINGYGYAGCVTGYGSSVGSLSFTAKFAICYDGLDFVSIWVYNAGTFIIHLAGKNSLLERLVNSSTTSPNFEFSGYYVVIG